MHNIGDVFCVCECALISAQSAHVLSALPFCFSFVSFFFSFLLKSDQF